MATTWSLNTTTHRILSCHIEEEAIYLDIDIYIISKVPAWATGLIKYLGIFHDRALDSNMLFKILRNFWKG